MAIDFGTLILNETPDAVIVTTPQGQVVSWIGAACALFGYGPEEVAGQVLAELIVPPELRAAHGSVVRKVLEHGSATFEAMRRSRDGTLLYVDGSGKAIRGADGAVNHILWSEKDVTDLKAMRDAKLVEARFRDVLESTPDGIIMVNSNGRIVLANAHAERLFGYAPGELLGKPLEVLLPRRFHDAHLRQRVDYLNAPRSRAMGAGRELFGVRKNDEEFPVEISLSPIATEEGTLIMSAIRDTTARRAIERALSEKNLELENANLAKDRFLASMSHELRTPLNAIIGFTGTMLMKLPGPITVDQDKQLRTIQSSARQLLALINDLLDLTKIESGKVELHPEPVLCQQLVDELGATFRAQAREKGLQLILDCPARPLTLSTDRRALQQILMNLMNNALKFTEAGEVQLTLSERSGEQGDSVEFRISDTGIGILPASQAKLFQAFSQLDTSSTRRFEGTGLGLHLSQKLAALLNGRIGFDSQHGVGSVFTLTLPAGQ